jgi:hypothetical protein
VLTDSQEIVCELPDCHSESSVGEVTLTALPSEAATTSVVKMAVYMVNASCGLKSVVG